MNNIDKQLVLNDKQAVAEQALKLVLDAADKAIAARGRFVLGLAGGSTPEALYQLLAQQAIDWQHWYLIHGDERCLPMNDPDRNTTMVEHAWLIDTAFPVGNHFPIPAEAGAELASQSYQKTIAELLPMDFCLLGMGEDGHTASLFPGHNAQIGDVIAVHDSPKPPSDRVSLNYSVINQSRQVCFLVTGAGKIEALKAWANGEALPVSQIQGEETYLLLDQAAADYR